MQILLHILLSAIAISVAAFLTGANVESFWVAIVVAIVLGLINAFLKPVLEILTLPINILTLGLFSVVLNVLLIMLASAIVPGFDVHGFWNALWFSLVLWLINQLFASFGDSK